MNAFEMKHSDAGHSIVIEGEAFSLFGREIWMLSVVVDGKAHDVGVHTSDPLRDAPKIMRRLQRELTSG